MFQQRAHDNILAELHTLPIDPEELPLDAIISNATPINAIRAQTERLLWHQRLGHPSDERLYTAHKFIDGVPQFKHHDPVLDKCPVCIRSKQTKEPAGINSTRKATRPFQGLSIDFSFSGTKSKNKDQQKDYVGINGETSWILVSDHFSRMLIGDTRISKASPINWLKKFLKTYSPHCTNKYVVLDQGGELYGNPKVRKLFQQYDYAIHPTGADSSHQNGPVERNHQTMANHVRCLLDGANLDIKFWPYAFWHQIRILNGLVGSGQTKSPIQIALNQKENLCNFRTFGCRVWVRPSTR